MTDTVREQRARTDGVIWACAQMLGPFGSGGESAAAEILAAWGVKEAEIETRIRDGRITESEAPRMRKLYREESQLQDLRRKRRAA